jgi:hypothetical protein
MHEVSSVPQFGANVIARASGAKPIPEVDQPIPDLENVAPLIATTEASAVQQMPALQSEEEFHANQQRIVRKLQYGPLALITGICGGIYLLQAVANAPVEYGSSGGLGAATAYLAGVAVAVVIAVGAIYAVSLLFSCDMGTFWSILLRSAAIKTMADVAILGVAAAAGTTVGSIVGIALAIALLRWMFKLDPLQLAVAVLINGLARLVLLGAAFGALMNGQV